MRLARCVVVAVAVLAAAPAMAQDRMPPIPADKMSEAQTQAAAQFKANRGQDVFGPFVPLSRSPEVMLRTMALGIVKAIAEGRRPAGMSADQELAYDFTTELLQNHSVSDATYARAVARFGEQGTIELVTVAGYYTYQSMVLNTARTPVATPPALTLKPLP